MGLSTSSPPPEGKSCAETSRKSPPCCRQQPALPLTAIPVGPGPLSAWRPWHLSPPPATPTGARPALPRIGNAKRGGVLPAPDCGAALRARRKRSESTTPSSNLPWTPLRSVQAVSLADLFPYILRLPHPLPRAAASRPPELPIRGMAFRRMAFASW